MSRICGLYKDLAGYYDHFCAGVDYSGQCDFAARAFESFAVSGGRDYLDLACGSGQHIRFMQERGFKATGLDNSSHMLQLARQRCPEAELLLCDLAGFDQRCAFDLITCFLYSIHYSYPESAFTETVRRAWEALKPGGLLLFNAVDARGAMKPNPTRTQIIDGEATLDFASNWNYDGKGSPLHLDLHIKRRVDGAHQSWRDQHVMTAITFGTLESILMEIGFTVILLEHDYERMQALRAESFNAIVLACKPLSDSRQR